MEWFEKLYTKNYINLCGFGSTEQTKKEAEFVVDVLGLSSDSKLLDLCCGFGRHTFEISKLVNCQIVGVDLSDDYLTIARDKYSTHDIKYIKGDMRDIKVDEQFDAVTNLFTSFGFFESDEQNEKVIQQANKVLKLGGLFLLDIENRFSFVINDVLKKEYYWQQLGENKFYLIHNKYDIVNEREIFSAKIIEDGKEEVRVSYNIRLYSLPELTSMFKRNNFELVHCWGDYDKSEYSIQSRRLIILSQKNCS